MTVHVLVLMTVLLRSSSGQAPPQESRAAGIDQARREKIAVLWPERQSPMVKRTDHWLERGLRTGVDDAKGINGLQLLLGGTRSGQGVAGGVGYRKTDVLRDHLDARTTLRGTPQKALLLDGDFTFRGGRSERTFVNIYTKYERSPHIDFYGFGPDSKESNLTSYEFNDAAIDASAGFDIRKWMRVGVTGGTIAVYTAPAEDFVMPVSAGIGTDTRFDRWGGFLAFDYRDRSSGPRRGGVYGMRFRQYFDRTTDSFNFRQVELEAQQYIPYFNKMRVIALRAAAVLSFEDEGHEVPAYLMPTIGGNDDVRGFERYRFRDKHSLLFSAEHRWYVFRGLDMAIFGDAGTVAAKRWDLDVGKMVASGGIGFRTRLRDVIVMRNDFAWGREGFRWMWTFSDIFRMGY